MADAQDVTAYFTQKAGRAPTEAELAAYTPLPNFQQAIDANVAAPNGYANFLAHGDANWKADAPSAQAPGQIPGYGIAPAAYQSPYAAASYSAPSLAAIPQYQAPKAYVAPTTEEAMNAPGVQVGARLAREGAENSAAAKGSVLNGGFQKALAQYLQDYGTTKYGEVLNQGESVYGLNANTQLGAYTANTGAALASNNQLLGAADQAFRNNSASTNTNNQNRYMDYMTNYGTSHQAANDYYTALQDQAHTGAAAGTAQVTA